jgi:simple sugar transport system ATP-binding protein
VRGGEIVGIAGVEGNGQHELVECLAGLRPPARGEIVIAGHRCSGRSAREHLAAGLAHIPSDRLRRALVPEMTLAENLVLGLQRSPSLGRGPWLHREALRRRAIPLLAEYDVRPPDPLIRAAQLSGGNQQKLVAARELARGAPVVLAAHPTRGLDLGAIAFLHGRLLAERSAGRAVLLVSSELSEILALSDRIFVIYEGRLVHETRCSETDERTLGLYMTGRREAAAGAAAPPAALGS